LVHNASFWLSNVYLIINGHTLRYIFVFCKDLLQLCLDLVIFLVREGLIYLHQRYGLIPLSPRLFSSLSRCVSIHLKIRGLILILYQHISYGVSLGWIMLWNDSQWKTKVYHQICYKVNSHDLRRINAQHVWIRKYFCKHVFHVNWHHPLDLPKVEATITIHEKTCIYQIGWSHHNHPLETFNKALEWGGGEAGVKGNCYDEFVCGMLHEKNNWSHFGRKV
jgi:hypothetical protein